MVDSCAIVTAEANQLASTIHNRMPAIVRLDGYETWLKAKDYEWAEDYFTPYDRI